MITVVNRDILKAISFFIILMMIAFPSYASVKNTYLGEVHVHIEGAERTKDRTVEFLVEQCLSKENYKNWEQVDPAGLGQCISNSRLFESVKVRAKKPDIFVLVVDRWTLLPGLTGYSINGNSLIGAVIVDTNFLGYAKKVEAIGAWSTEGNTFILAYVDPMVNFSKATLQMSINESIMELDQYRRSSIIYAFMKKERSFFISPGYRITPTLEFSVLLNYTRRQYDTINSYTTLPDNYWSYSAGARLSYANTDYKIYYNDGISTSIQWLRQIYRSDESDYVSETSARFELDKALYKDNACLIVINTSSLIDSANLGDNLMFGNEKGYRGIAPNGLWTRRSAAVSFDYQIPVKKVTDGIFTVAPFADYGIYEPISPVTGNHYFAYGAGGYFFFNDMPGVLGILAGRNESFMGAFVSVQVGYGF
jgi:outer membrane protein assembly factor BamA